MPWVDGLCIGDMLRQTAARYPDLDALVFSRLDAAGRLREHAAKDCFRLSYRGLDAEVDAVARALMGMGIEKGQHVAVWATNWPRWMLLQYATARIGAVQVTVNPAYRTSELAYVLKQSDATALFLIDCFRKSNYLEMLAAAVPETTEHAPGELQAANFPNLRHIVALHDDAGRAGGVSPPMRSLLSWHAFLEQGEAVPLEEVHAREKTLDPHEPINIQYTSGTTGFPKGAMLTHRNLLLNAFYVGDCQRLSHEDRVCVPVPFYHCFGCVLGVLCCGVYGAAMIVPNEYFQPEATLEAIESERATSVYGVPTMFIAQLEHPTFSGRDLTSLRTGIMAGSPCPIEVMKRVVDDMGAREVTIAYGLTEASPVITQTRTDDPLELRVKTVGRPIPDIEVKLVDPGTGETLGDNQPGELCTRGHVVMRGYYNNPEATAAAIDADGWLHSGDLAVRQPNGYYRITGRIKDMICRGGENIYPREIEEFLYTHPAIEDVAVVGVPDPKFVEDVAAWVRLKDGASATEDEIREFCRKSLAHFKVPRYVKFVTEFPQTVTGKIQKFKIREQMIEELGLEQAETA
ncbi:MAG: AMP-binding protein [Planctomycetes bacterium]|nr:AMP-binding protein [Planctomycetota bacterium]